MSEVPSVLTYVRLQSLSALESDLLALEARSASTAPTKSTTTAAALATTATAAPASKAAATTAATETATTAASATATTSAAAEASFLPRLLAGEVKSHSTGTPALADVRTVLGVECSLRILNRVEGHVAETLAVSRFP